MKKRDVRLLLLGILFGVIISFIIDLLWDWEGNVASFKKGYNDAKSPHTENTE